MVFRQVTFYLAELFRQAKFYLVELFRQTTFYLAELYCQIAFLIILDLIKSYYWFHCKQNLMNRIGTCEQASKIPLSVFYTQVGLFLGLGLS